MEVKGTGILATRSFVETQFADQYQYFIHELPIESKKIYTDVIKTSQWYSIEDAYYYPVKTIANMFFNGDEKKAGDALGRYSADYALNGIYKVFLMIASPQSLMKAAKRIISLYYKPIHVEISDVTKKSLVLSTSKMPVPSPILDYRVAAWCQRSLELAHCDNVKYEFITPNSKEDIAILLTWD